MPPDGEELAWVVLRLAVPPSEQSGPELVERPCWCAQCRHERRPCAIRRLRLGRVYGDGPAARTAATRRSKADAAAHYEVAQVPLAVVTTTARLVREGLTPHDALGVALELLEIREWRWSGLRP